MLKLSALVALLWARITAVVPVVDGDDRGSITVEKAIIAVVAAAMATFAAGAIYAAVQGKLGGFSL